MPKDILENQFPIEHAASLVEELYRHPDCQAGGYLHIVTDDGNVETHHIEWCLADAVKSKILKRPATDIEIKCGEALLELPEEQRWKAIQIGVRRARYTN